MENKIVSFFCLPLFLVLSISCIPKNIFKQGNAQVKSSDSSIVKRLQGEWRMEDDVTQKVVFKKNMAYFISRRDIDSFNFKIGTEIAYFDRKKKKSITLHSNQQEQIIAYFKMEDLSHYDIIISFESQKMVVMSGDNSQTVSYKKMN